jgi:D-aminoacyl-tRNA deacylase
MRVVLQRVREASVDVDGSVVGKIGSGLLILAGIGAEDDETSLKIMAEKIVNLRIFEDEIGKMNLSLLDMGGAILAVSQFTLFADCRKGRRPNFMNAAPSDTAAKLFARFVEVLKSMGPTVETGVFQAMMEVKLNNWGPVTIVLDSAELSK